MIFLAQANGKRAKVFFDLIQAQSFQNLSIQTYTHLIPAQQYQHLLQESDFLILPLRQHIRFGLVLNQLTQRYHHATDLAEVLIQWINQRAYQILAEQAISQLTIFSKSQQSQRLWEILKPLL